MTCAIYCRLSKEDENSLQESESIQNQKNLLINHAVQQEWDIYNIYCDDDYSGADADRPEWNDMLRAAQAGKFEIVLCKNQSRFTRDIEMVEKYIHGLFPLWGIRFVAVLDNVDTAVKGNKKARQINGLINEWYLEDLSENVKAVLDQKRRQGKFIGSFASYGYLKDPEDRNKLIVDEEAAETVRQIFDWFVSGVGTQHIAHRLNEGGVLNPSKYKQAKGLGYVNGAERDGKGYWNSTTVARILKNELYTGTLIQGTKRKASYKSKKLISVPEEQWVRIPNTHEAIVDQHTFDAANRRIRKRTRSSGKGEAHVLAGKLQCSDCGNTMIKIANGYKVKPRYYMQCATYADTRGNPECTKHSIRLDILMEAVEKQIRHHVGQFYEAGDIRRFESEDRIRSRVQSIQKDIAAAMQQIDRISVTTRNLYMEKVEGTISQEQFLSMNEGFLADKARLEKQIQLLENRLEELGQRKADNARLEGRVKELLALDDIGRELYDLLIDTIVIGEKDAVANMQEINIKWKI